jgi:hypothetical protein
MQQILVVDLLLRDKIPFLLGQLLPLMYLVKYGQIFLNVARSRNFDCVELCTDRESAFSIMAEKLSAFDIEPDVAVCGQYVPVIECKTRTI